MFPIKLLLLVLSILGLLVFFNRSDDRGGFIKSIDTTKYSRDLGREKGRDPSFNNEITKQMDEIAWAGANYVALGTPYDSEFTPYLKSWIEIARSKGLKIWFRGNFAGWEGWFNYPRINAETHLTKTENFILQNADLFADGDIFTSCTECENGNLGDPRETKDVTGYRIFLIKEYKVSISAFNRIGKKVNVGYFSMNLDVANLVMDKKTTRSLGGVVVVDHYEKDPESLVANLKSLAKNSGGKVILGEVGAPIPDIHGSMTEEEQSQWISSLMQNLENFSELEGINYWVNQGGSTALWNLDATPKKGAFILRSYFRNWIKNEGGR